MAKNSFPRFSVILCNYNHAAYLTESLPVILRQLRPQDELILVDDGSTDNSLQVMRDLVGQQENVRILINEQNLGVVRSGNRALNVAQGDFVGWWSADDLILDGFLEAAASTLRQFPKAGVVASETIIETVSAGMEPKRRLYNFDLPGPGYLSAEGFVAENRKRYVWLASSGLLVRREALLAEGGWREDLAWLCDWHAVYVTALRHGVAFIAEPFSVLRERQDSYGRLAANSPAARRPVVRRFFDLLATPEFAEVRSRLRLAPLILSHAFGDRLFRELAARPRDWDLWLAAASAVIRARLIQRIKRMGP